MIETAIKILPFDANLTDELKKLEDEGWQLLAGTKPLITYQVGRNPPALGGEGGVIIDDSKVVTIRNGKVVRHG